MACSQDKVMSQGRRQWSGAAIRASEDAEARMRAIKSLEICFNFRANLNSRASSLHRVRKRVPP